VGTTITGKLEVAVLVPSLTVTVIGTTPDWPETDATVTVRLVPLPPNTILVLGTRVVLAELPDKVRLPGVSRSPMVKGSAVVEPPDTVVPSGISDIVGGVLAG